MVKNFEPSRSLTGHDIRMVEGVDEHGPRRARKLGCSAQRLVDRVTAQHDICSVVPGRLELGQGNTDGHEDGGLDSENARRKCNALSVVARGGRDNTASLLLVGES